MLLKRKDTLFREDEKALNLYFLTNGEIKIYNTDSEGKEFLIEKVSNFKFLGEPPFLLGERYPANSVIISDTAEIFRFSTEHFNQFMSENPDMMFKFTMEIARKAYNKTMKLKSIVHQNPNERILNFLKNYKRSHNLELTEKSIIEVTRKEMANSTGLAIETVIRTVKKMERENKIELINHKILF
ncbi:MULTISPECIES: Crp/Fnr family transcriptional regulator [Chryseobacterium]|uniref:Crp/Fnr family transcriptional regulator n=1 Tax=Chryseobacterium sp. R2A-55 TaxID=2744445 RepID=UPI001F38619F|nr:Crp/Fnr family transcriptional regulator [Chryseobacterium sp. R2A-55]